MAHKESSPPFLREVFRHKVGVATLSSNNKTDTQKVWCSGASLKHLIQDSLESVILQRRSNSLLVGQLLVHLVVLGVAILLTFDMDAIVGWEYLVQSYADA